VNDDALKLTVYFGERDRANGGFLADALIDIYARQRLQTSLVMRGVEGFGVHHHLRTDRLLTLSEDLPMVSVAVDGREQIATALSEVERLRFHGLVTLERARLLVGGLQSAEVPAELGDEIKLTAYVGRQDRVGRTPAYEAIVALLRERGVTGATVLLGVDGTAHGIRQRARFFARNAQVPLMVIAVGARAHIASVLTDLGSMLERPLVTLERARVCKSDGRFLADPRHLPETDPSGRRVWQKLMVYSGEQSRHAGHPLHDQLIRRLRSAGAAGATSLRGIWGYHGDHPPHGDTFWQLQRRVPILTVIVDTPERMQGWFEIVDEVTDAAGVVTSEMVPAFRATGPSIEQGGLRLARLE
jgi:PII-like signaling protein